MLHPEILGEVKKYVSKRFNNEAEKRLAYHNLDHVKMVANTAAEIAEHSNISTEDQEVLLIAAWFHDIGYLHQGHDHELASKRIARDFLQRQQYPEDKIKRVEECIMATQMPQSPKNKLEEIICDADMIHLAKAQYLDIAEGIRRELEFQHDKSIPDNDWLKSNRKFLKDHSFFTPYVKEKYGKGVKENRELLIEMLRKRDNLNI